MLVSILYIASALYSIFVFCNVAENAWKRKRFVRLRKELYFSGGEKSILNRCVPIFLTICLIMPLVDFCDVVNKIIPEDTYTVEATVTIDDEDNKYVLPLSIYYFEDYESETDYDSEPLFLGNYSKNVEITRSFRFCDNQKIDFHFDGFVPEYFDFLPEEISSGESFRSSIAGRIIGDDDLTYGYLDCIITMPSFTYETLGLTTQDILETISLWGYLEHILLFLISLINFSIFVFGKD